MRTVIAKKVGSKHYRAMTQTPCAFGR
jgi:hypothetical protein